MPENRTTQRAAEARPLGLLIVDDEEPIRRMLGQGMQGYGFAVWLAVDGPNAVEVYQRHRDAIDIVLLDVRMPGQDGPQTLVALRQVGPGLRFYFMSGDTGRYTVESLLQLGAGAVFEKPLQLKDLAREFLRAAPGCGSDRNG